MKTLVRTLLVWFVLLAVPFQGFAAAAMTCAHGVAASPAHAQAQAPAQPPCHGDGAQAAKAGDAHGGHAVAQDSAHADEASPHPTSCGNCSACSVGAAMAPASIPQAPSCCPCSCCPSAAPVRVAVADPDLPERPPRTTLA